VGAPQLDELVAGKYSSEEEIKCSLGFDVTRDFILVVQHPVTEEFEVADKQIEETMKAVNKFNIPKIVILPNNDAGSVKVRVGIENFLRGEYFIYSNLKRQDYLGLLKYTKVIVGNSSSGLLEAPTFKTPAVNLGRRQMGRDQGTNVINADFDEFEEAQKFDFGVPGFTTLHSDEGIEIARQSLENIFDSYRDSVNAAETGDLEYFSRFIADI
jgi:UDP-N-acetylglucosamine 2-epimerase